MRTCVLRNCVLPAIGLASLAVYIIACSQFSPDDSKVLFPAFDEKSGAACVSVYERKTGTSEAVFVPRKIGPLVVGESGLHFLRPQWFPDGRRILVAFTGGGEHVEVDVGLAVLPFGAREPVRLFPFSEDLGPRGYFLALPLCLSGLRVFLPAVEGVVKWRQNQPGRVEENGPEDVEENEPEDVDEDEPGGVQENEPEGNRERSRFPRIDLETGKVEKHEFPSSVGLWAAGDGKTVLALHASERDPEEYIVSRLNPETWALEPLSRWKSDSRLLGVRKGTLAVSADGTKFASFGRSPDRAAAWLVSEGRVQLWDRPELLDANLDFCGLGALSPRGDCFYATFRRKEGESAEAAYGVVEVPLSDAPLRWKDLLRGSARHAESDGDLSLAYFQPALSHDGKTLAIASTYLWASDGAVAAEDCALFLIDLPDPERKVTKVPIRPPAVRPGGKE